MNDPVTQLNVGHERMILIDMAEDRAHNMDRNQSAVLHNKL